MVEAAANCWIRILLSLEKAAAGYRACGNQIDIKTTLFA
jgi:hypothetical protein